MRTWQGRIRGIGLLLGLFGVLASAANCGSDGDSSQDGAGAGAGAGGGNGTGGTGAVFDLDASPGDSGDGSTIDPDAACATASEEATLVPVNMIIMFDRSGSMDQSNKWPNATAALTAFFEDPGTAGLRIALRFFPDDTPTSGCNDDDCSIPACADPLVALGAVTAAPAPADGQEEALVSAVEGQSTGSGQGTPMYAALGGAEQWATAYADAHPTEKEVVILVTDGEPNGCNEDIDDIAQLAADALADHNVATYAVGLEGSAEAQMNQIAEAGGTGQGIFIGSGDAQAELLAALKAIQGSQVSCVFAMPEGEPGAPVDPNKVNVNYTSGSSDTETIGQVSGASDCQNGGWYYDDALNPSTITLCPSTCATVQADPGAKMEILLGCATQVQPPPS